MHTNLAKPITGLFLLMVLSSGLFAQTGRFQQAASYQMDIDMNVQTNQYTGTQVLTYTNNSPDTLDRVFYHLYFNAFQPGSMMDERSRSIADPDRRVGDRISKLKPDEIGFLRVNSLKMNGKDVVYNEVGTILEVDLSTPILPNTTVKFDMSFTGQVPVQIRRSGRDSAEGVRYSMAQWYPKMSEYDEQGWHANPYIGREFYGIWGDFDIKITIDKTYVLGGTGYVQNPNEVGHGYEDAGAKVTPPKGDKLTWHFNAPKVTDFMWAADPKYRHDKLVMDNGVTVHHLYIPTPDVTENWVKLMDYTPKAIEYMSEHFGEYPYKQYSVIQGGDGGMEYPMSTLVTGGRNLSSLVGVMAHELGHSWYQGVIATNEALYPWMDEGFASYAAALTMAEIFKPNDNPLRGSYAGYFRLAKSGKEEPMSTHSDHYDTNGSYSAAAYSKGAVFLAQMGYIIGEEARDKGILSYWNTWGFKHPNANDFIRIMEKESGLELDWYKEYFVYTTKTIDYGIKEMKAAGDQSDITLERIGLMPMPIDLVITYKDGSKEMVYLPLEIMRGEKPAEAGAPQRIISQDWPWTNLTKTIRINKKADSIKSIEIDPTSRLADINPDNNKVEY
ncbi:MAG: M1 family metallopeptidase [Algoriphagus sp.]|uniref:M1 family metallopeptidase n=1 Tax=Algoriphagus sp. TaxID=1872435 RepID=UPI00329748FD